MDIRAELNRALAAAASMGDKIMAEADSKAEAVEIIIIITMAAMEFTTGLATAMAMATGMAMEIGMTLEMTIVRALVAAAEMEAEMETIITIIMARAMAMAMAMMARRGERVKIKIFIAWLAI